MRPATLVLLGLGLAMALTSWAQQAQPGGQMSLDQRFKQLDRNGDGKLTPDELQGEWFVRLDANKDGFVTLEEAKAALAR